MAEEGEQVPCLSETLCPYAPQFLVWESPCPQGRSSSGRGRFCLQEDLGLPWRTRPWGAPVLSFCLISRTYLTVLGKKEHLAYCLVLTVPASAILLRTVSCAWELGFRHEQGQLLSTWTASLARPRSTSSQKDKRTRRGTPVVEVPLGFLSQNTYPLCFVNLPDAFLTSVFGILFVLKHFHVYFSF